MASSTGTSSGASQLQNPGSEGDLQKTMDQKKRKRMVSNRESAQRSRMRKQNHLNELVVQMGQLSSKNSQIITNMKLTCQLYINLDAENSILRAQLAELTHLLGSLNEIINCFNSADGFYETDHHDDLMLSSGFDSFLNPWNSVNVNQAVVAGCLPYCLKTQ